MPLTPSVAQVITDMTQNVGHNKAKEEPSLDETETSEAKSSVPSTRESASGSIKSRVKEPIVTEAQRDANKLSVDLKKKPRKKRLFWSEEEHEQFLKGLEVHGKGSWRLISTNFVTSRTPSQVASHAQKYFLRLAREKRAQALPFQQAYFSGQSMPTVYQFNAYRHNHHQPAPSQPQTQMRPLSWHHSAPTQMQNSNNNNNNNNNNNVPAPAPIQWHSSANSLYQGSHGTLDTQNNSATAYRMPPPFYHNPSLSVNMNYWYPTAPPPASVSTTGTHMTNHNASMFVAPPMSSSSLATGFTGVGTDYNKELGMQERFLLTTAPDPADSNLLPPIMAPILPSNNQQDLNQDS